MGVNLAPVANIGGVNTAKAGAYASLPAAGHAGAFYYATDRKVWYYDNGTSFASLLETANTWTGAQTWTSAQCAFSGVHLGTYFYGNIAALNTAITVTSGQVYQNVNAAYRVYRIPVTFNPTSSLAATCAVALGSSSSPATIDTTTIPANGLAGTVLVIELRVPPVWYFSLTATNATIGAAVYVQE